MLAAGGASLIDPADNIHPLNAGHAVIANAVLASTATNTKPVPALTTSGVVALTLGFTLSAPASGTVTNYTVEYGVEGSYVYGNTQTVTSLTGGNWTVTSGTYRVRVRANFSDGTKSPWVFSGATAVGNGSQFLVDSFTDTTGTAITAHTPETGGAWVLQTGYAPTNPLTISSTGTAYARDGLDVYRNTAAPASADYYVECVLVWKSTKSDDAMGVMGRADAAANTLYWARFSASAGGYQLFKTVAGTNTQLGTTQTATFTSGSHTVRLTMLGSTISMSVDGTTLVSVTDTAITAAGFAGVRCSPTVAQSDTTGIQMTSILASA